jgi:hypothetical protein
LENPSPIEESLAKELVELTFQRLQEIDQPSLSK